MLNNIFNIIILEKLWLIIKREYLTRVKKRTFILATILTPVAFAFFIVIVGFIFSYEDGDTRSIAIHDPAKILGDNGFKSKKDGSLHFVNTTVELEELKLEVQLGKYDGIIVLPQIKNLYSKQEKVYYYSDDQLGLDVRATILDRVSNCVQNYKVKALDIDMRQLDAINPKIVFDPKPISDNQEDESTIAGVIAAGIGGFMGMIMYMTVFIYGMMVMRSVMEEKVNRIVEIMISSVKPFTLMMGKIIGVGAVGLTQISIWAVLIPLLTLLVNLLFGFENTMQPAGMSSEMIDANMNMEETQFMAEQVLAELKNQNWLMIIPLFIFYFLGGYFLYASMFAAVGSAMSDDMGEGQALTIPITIPVILAFYIMIVAVRAPDSNLAIWSSIFPLFSPIVMPARLAFSPPVWQIALSMTVLALSAIFFVWLSAKIYRIGILMYGKKVSLREIGRWLFSRD